MKTIKYKIPGYIGIHNPLTEETEQTDCLVGVERPYTEENVTTAQKEAYLGQYTVEDDGVEAQPTDAERIAELEEALALLLSGVTE